MPRLRLNVPDTAVFSSAPADQSAEGSTDTNGRPQKPIRRWYYTALDGTVACSVRESRRPTPHAQTSSLVTLSSSLPLRLCKLTRTHVSPCDCPCPSAVRVRRSGHRPRARAVRARPRLGPLPSLHNKRPPFPPSSAPATAVTALQSSPLCVCTALCRGTAWCDAGLTTLIDRHISVRVHGFFPGLAVQAVLKRPEGPHGSSCAVLDGQARTPDGYSIRTRLRARH